MPNEIPLRILRHLLGAFSHALRTPLGTISNDLHYAKVSNAPLCPEALRAELDKMVHVLNRARLPAVSLSTESPVPIAPMCIALHMHVDASVNDVAWNGDVAIVSALFSALSALGQWSVLADTSKSLLIMKMLTSGDRTASFSLFSELVNEHLGIDSFEAPLADAFMLYLGISMEGQRSRDVVEIKLRMPHA